MPETSYWFSPSERGFYSNEPDSAPPPADAQPISAEEHAALIAGQAAGKAIMWGPDGPYLADRIKSEEQLLAGIRTQRDALLLASDWTQLPDAPLTTDQRAAWAAYRQELRDLPQTYSSNPADAVWPTPPTEEISHAS